MIPPPSGRLAEIVGERARLMLARDDEGRVPSTVEIAADDQRPDDRLGDGEYEGRRPSRRISALQRWRSTHFPWRATCDRAQPRRQALELCLRRHTFLVTRLPESSGTVDGRFSDVRADEHQSHGHYTDR